MAAWAAMPGGRGASGADAGEPPCPVWANVLAAQIPNKRLAVPALPNPWRRTDHAGFCPLAKIILT